MEWTHPDGNWSHAGTRHRHYGNVGNELPVDITDKGGIWFNNEGGFWDIMHYIQLSASTNYLNIPTRRHPINHKWSHHRTSGQVRIRPMGPFLLVPASRSARRGHINHLCIEGMSIDPRCRRPVDSIPTTVFTHQGIWSSRAKPTSTRTHRYNDLDREPPKLRL